MRIDLANKASADYITSMVLGVYSYKNLPLVDKFVLLGCLATVPLAKIPNVFGNPKLFDPILGTYTGFIFGASLGFSDIKILQKMKLNPKKEEVLLNLAQMFSTFSSIIDEQLFRPINRFFLAPQKYANITQPQFETAHTAKKLYLFMLGGLGLGFLVAVATVSKKEKRSFMQVLKDTLKKFINKNEKQFAAILQTALWIGLVVYLSKKAYGNANEIWKQAELKKKAPTIKTTYLERFVENIISLFFKPVIQYKNLKTLYKDDIFVFFGKESLLQSIPESTTNKVIRSLTILRSKITSSNIKISIFIIDKPIKNAYNSILTLGKITPGSPLLNHVVLYKELIDSLSTEELAGVIAHEVGHSIHFDVSSALGITGLVIGLAALISSATAYQAILGLEGLLMNSLGRFAEMRADSFAANLGLGSYLASGLAKLHGDLSDNLIHFFDVHGNPKQRIEALKKLGQQIEQQSKKVKNG